MLMFKMFHITLQSETKLIARQTPTQRVIELRVRAPEVPEDGFRSPVNLALVIDRSGSMQGMKLAYVKEAANFVTELLTQGDRLAVISFDEQVTVDVPSTPITESVQAEIEERIASIQPGGTTNLAGGWTQGCQEVAANAESRQNINRVLLLTDGLANVGITDLEILSAHAHELAERGVATSTFGVGEGFNEHLLEGMANQGSGNFYYISSPRMIQNIFFRELKKLASVTAHNILVDLTLPDHAAVEVLGGWRHTQEGNKLQLFLGDLSDQHEQVVYLRLLLPPSDDRQGLTVNAAASAIGMNGRDLSDEAKLHFQYADADDVAKSPLAQDVLERYARVEMSDKTTAALKLEREGQRDKAKKIILQSLEQNRPNLQPAQAQYYENIADRMEQGMAEPDRKSSQYQSYKTRRQRPPDE